VGWFQCRKVSPSYVETELKGLTCRKVDKSLYDGESRLSGVAAKATVTVVSPNSYFSFTPFLASTAVGTLEFRCATEPVRSLKGVHFAQGWANKLGMSCSLPCVIANAQTLRTRRSRLSRHYRPLMILRKTRWTTTSIPLFYPPKSV
jgi:hypothetical protein